MQIFCVKSVKIYTGQKNLHGYACGARDKYQVCKGDDGEGGNKCDGGYGWEAGYHVDDGEQV